MMGSRQENWFYSQLKSSAERGATCRLSFPSPFVPIDTAFELCFRSYRLPGPVPRFTSDTKREILTPKIFRESDRITNCILPNQ